MTSRRLARSASLVSLISFAALFPGPASADWPTSPTTNLPICTAANTQNLPCIATDMAGGAYIAWQDQRISTDVNIYAGHVLASGVVDPTWPANGLLVCAAPGSQFLAQAVSDGEGGLLLAWTDQRSGTNHIYAGHVLANATVDPIWPANGLAVCTASGSQTSLRMVSDEAGGAVLAWRDLRNDTDLYAMRVLANGTVDATWPANGLALASGTGTQKFTSVTPMVPDGHGGFFATWQDTRNGLEPDIYAQHLLVNGTVAPGWQANGLAVCTAPNIQQFPGIATDGAGGVFVGWEDLRGAVAYDIYVQHIGVNGTVDPAWPLDGRATCTAAGNQTRAALVADASGGVFVGWTDARAGNPPALFAQHVLASGTLDPVWPVGDLAFNAALGSHINLRLLQDGTGGALAVWDDDRSGFNVYSQHILVSGVTDPAWPATGSGVSTAPGDQSAAGAAIPDGSGGLIAAWGDARSGALDIYAQRVQANGQLGGSVVGVQRGPTANTFALASVSPTPSRGDRLGLQFTLPTGGRVTLELLDVAGRRTAKEELGVISQGVHSFDWKLERRPRPGLYMLRFQFGKEVGSRRVVIID